MKIEPSGAQPRTRAPEHHTGRSDERYRRLSATLKTAVSRTSSSSAANLHGLESLARSLAHAARGLSRGSGYARHGRDVAQEARRTLLAMQSAAQRIVDGDTEAGRELDALRKSVARLGGSSFEGLPVFSSVAVRVEVESADLSAAEPVEIRTSAPAREALAAAAEPLDRDVDGGLGRIERAIEATETLSREFEATSRRLEGSRAIVAQERLDELDRVPVVRAEHTEVDRLAESVSRELDRDAASSALVHERPDTQVLLSLLDGLAA